MFMAIIIYFFHTFEVYKYYGAIPLETETNFQPGPGVDFLCHNLHKSPSSQVTGDAQRSSNLAEFHASASCHVMIRPGE